MKLDKGQTKRCKKCRAEMTYLELEDKKRIYVCGECGEVVTTVGEK